MSHSPRVPYTLTVFLLVASLLPAFALSVEAKGKKGGRAVAGAKGKSGKQARAGSRSTRRLARGRHRGADDSFQVMPAHYIVPDRIEVLENASATSVDLARWLNMPAPQVSLSNAFADIEAVAATRRRSVNIDQARVLQIQQALATRGFYAGEMTGAYDEATIEAMRRFQASSRISVTGYPTAHALKRLGLGEW